MQKLLMKLVLALASFALIMQMCSCMANPEHNTVISKNSDSSSKEPGTEQRTDDTRESIELTDDFYSTDKSVHFLLNSEVSLETNNFPTVEVAPHYLTEVDAERVAQVLFNDATGYEEQPLLALAYSKPEIQKNIARWAPYTSSEKVAALLGVEDDFTVEVVKNRIADLTVQYETAPDSSNRIPCQWKFQKEAYYNFTGDEAIAAENYLDNDMIMATYEISGAVYDYSVVTRNKDDYKLNDISAYFHTAGSPMSIDAAIFQANFCRTPKPSDEEVGAVRNKAEKMLSEMGLGEWYVSDCTVDNRIPEIGEYVINVTAYPVLNGTNTLPVQQLTNLKSQANYASNYYMSITDFEFSANGDLISFHMSSPIDTMQIIDEETNVLDTRELIVRAQEHLTLSDAASYLPFETDAKTEKNIKCEVSIDDIRYGLSRVKIPNTDNIYYYVPSMMMMGNVTVQSKDGQKIIYATEHTQPLVHINAIDGTIIEKN